MNDWTLLARDNFTFQNQNGRTRRCGGDIMGAFHSTRRRIAGKPLGGGTATIGTRQYRNGSTVAEEWHQEEHHQRIDEIHVVHQLSESFLFSPIPFSRICRPWIYRPLFCFLKELQRQPFAAIFVRSRCFYRHCLVVESAICTGKRLHTVIIQSAYEVS